MVSLLKSAEADRKAERSALRNAFGQFATTNVRQTKRGPVSAKRKGLSGLDSLINGKGRGRGVLPL